MFAKPLTTYKSSRKDEAFLSKEICEEVILDLVYGGPPITRCKNKAINGIKYCPKCFYNFCGLKAKL